MDCLAKDFGATLIFRTKDISKLNQEAIQPHRIQAQIMVPIERKAFDLYNKVNESLDLTKDLSMRPKNNVATTIFDKNDFKAKNNVVVEKKPENTEQAPKPTKQAPIEAKPLDVNTEKQLDIHHAKRANVPKEKLPMADDIAKKIKDTPKSSKTFKIIAIFVAIGTAISGMIHFMKNKNKQQGEKENANSRNITSENQ